MSDLDSELLELVEEVPDNKKRKRSKGSSKGSKRRKAELSDSENEVESEEDDSNPYPYEGRFIDEADRQRLMNLSEIEREQILTQRDDELQAIADKKLITSFADDRQGQTQPDAVSAAVKRQHTARGATKEKSNKLHELREKRLAKSQKHTTKGSSPARERSSSPMDMETSDEDEDGQITKADQEDEKFDRKNKSSYRNNKLDDSPVNRETMSKVMVTRDQLMTMYKTPWFKDYAKGSWVRYLIGADEKTKEPVYRVCQITGVGEEPIKPYKIDNKSVDVELHLTHGSAMKRFPMDKVSNSEISNREFDRLERICKEENVVMPSTRDIMVRHDEMTTLWKKPMTDADISAMLNQRNTANPVKPPGWATMERSRLAQARILANGRHDYDEVAQIEAQMALLEPSDDAATAKQREAQDRLTKLSEKNRKANAEAVRRRELQDAERKRKERKLAVMSKSGTATPQKPAKNDSSGFTSGAPAVLVSETLESTSALALATAATASLADSFSLDIDF